MPLVETRGAASSGGFGQFARQVAANYIEDVFSTTLYTQFSDTSRLQVVTGPGLTSSKAWTANVYLNYADNYQTFSAVGSDGAYYLGQNDRIIKFSSAGSLVWSRRITSPTVIIRGIQVAASGNVYVLGEQNPWTPFVCKFNSSGTLQWTTASSSYATGSTCFFVDSSENVHVVFTLQSPLNGVYVRLNSNGSQIQSNYFSSGVQTFPKGIVVDSSGNILICGNYYDGVESYFAFIYKFTSAMVSTWRTRYYVSGAAAYVGNSYNGLGIDSSGNVYAVGGFRPNVRDEVVITKLNSSGVLQGHSRIFSASESLQAIGIAVSSSGNCVVTTNDVIAGLNSSLSLTWMKKIFSGSLNYMGFGPPAIDGLESLVVAAAVNETSTHNAAKTQICKVTQDGLFSGTTPYCTIAESDRSFGSASLTNASASVSVSSGPSFSSQSYTVATDTTTINSYTIPESNSTGGMVIARTRTSVSVPTVPLSSSQPVQAVQTSNSGGAFTGSSIVAVSSNGICVNGDSSSAPAVAWTFRKQPKFLDVVTYTGTGANRTISHGLGSIPGAIMVKRTDTTGDWQVYHRSLVNTDYLVLNSTAAQATGTTRWNSTTPTASVFSLGTDATVNASGGTYVAYLFAHNAGGFGEAGTDNVISCGTFATGFSGLFSDVTLGWEPQWILWKSSSSTATNWEISDVARGTIGGTSSIGGPFAYLSSNSSESSPNSTNVFTPHSNGFRGGTGTASTSYVYIAIRRGPMKSPTSATSVFGISARTGTGSATTVSGGQFADTVIIKNRGTTDTSLLASRLGGGQYGVTSSNAAWITFGGQIPSNPWDVADGIRVSAFGSGVNASANTYINYLFRRAPKFFDVIFYLGDNLASRNLPHNLLVVPELMIVKRLDNLGPWYTFVDQNTTPNANWYGNVLSLNTTDPSYSFGDLSAPTSTTVNVSTGSGINNSGRTYAMYLFASLAGISKVGKYTGTGAAQTINCGFTGGARFVMIKRTDTNGAWYYWDTARGIIAGNDPYLLLNSTAAEVTNTDYISVQSSGFGLTATAPADLNASGGSYIFLTIA